MDELAVGNFESLHHLKRLAQEDSNKALPEVAKQFEGIFLQAMLKSMRQSSSVLDENSPFKGKYTEQYQDMLDGQYASELSKGKGIGLADMLSKQLAKSNDLEVTHEKGLDVGRLSHPVPSQAVKMSETAHQTKPGVDSFVQSILPYAKRAAQFLGLDPKVLIAQAALETGWGQFIAKDEAGQTSNNLFNIKAPDKAKDASVAIKTTEYIANTPIKTTANFKKYNSIEKSFQDYVALITGNSRYQEALSQAGDAKQYIHALHKAGYATDPNYSSKIMAVYEGDELNLALQRAGFKGE